ncbi:hypothetical protein MXD62_19470 [Frankia sp. Mgl5]|uniref:hypothetical protein n=1 Tax=Frankia sp. Mgl5 TaxID=2933793 RepID=UPI00200CE637|nr:hypothetical protein [Frankia sp. Mgl5]MCK9929332.1 hypothetical protein [Frankia sp. Mgl5]
MALTADQRAFAETYLGSTFNEPTLEARLARLGDIGYAVREQVQVQLATFNNQPDSISIPGEYAQTIGGSRAGLEAALSDLPVPPGAPGGARVIPPDMSRWRR